VARHLERSFSNDFSTHTSFASAQELEAAGELVASKYATESWVNRLP
jgi:hypothetical protein